MTKNTKTYWKGLEQLTNEVDFVKNAHNEFGTPPSDLEMAADGVLGSQRRDFLKVLGFGVTAAALAGCEAPVKHAIPLLAKPEEYDPSIANYYASSYVDNGEYCPVIVKTREGRPIKLEGNTLSSITKGGTSARVQASVLNLYDNGRYKSAMAGKSALKWDAADATITAQLQSIAAAGGKIRLVSSSIFSPSTKAAIATFLAKYPTAKHIQYDAISVAALLDASKIANVEAGIPSYRFDNADVIVSFGADYLGTWLSPIEYAKQWSVNRKLVGGKTTMSKTYAFESIMSVTGASADIRTAIKPSEQGLYIAALYHALTGVGSAAGKASEDKSIQAAAKDLMAAKGKALVVSNSNDTTVQSLVVAINQVLHAYGSTIDIKAPTLTHLGNDVDMAAFVEEVKDGSVSAVIFYNVNPVYDYALGGVLKDNLTKVKLKISTALRPDETSFLVDFNTPDCHYLESWGDAEAKKGHYSLQQPAISNLYDTRQAQSSLLQWAGANTDYYAFVQSYWKSNIYPKQTQYGSFRDFWNYTLHDGIFEVGRAPFRSEMANAEMPHAPSVVAAADTTHEPAVIVATLLPQNIKVTVATGIVAGMGAVDGASIAASVIAAYKPSTTFDVVFYETVGMGAGQHASNPWLQEFPDPITRACWDNYVTLPVSYAKEKGIKVIEGNTTLVKVTVNGKSITIPAMVQPGQAKNTVGIALGYGRTIVGDAGKDRGQNVFPWLQVSDSTLQYWAANATIEPTTDDYRVAHVQTHHTIMGRDIIQESVLSEYQKNPAAGRNIEMVSTPDGKVKASSMSLWAVDHKYNNHSWKMMIDLNSCIGCGACVVGCQAENNVPIVGKEEVLNRREMHWIRIDRYFSTDAPEGDLAAMENAAENPEVVFQPMMCQHCNNAPCETVCPVLATTHSSEGLNQMTYNRCIGTRYCANNCPYKVRRFNWFSYPQNKDRFPYNTPTLSDVGRMVLNPDVTVRARGVMEKCSMCIQRVQEGKLNAKKESRRPIDGEINTACAQACPTNAITFGDYNDTNSTLHKLFTEQADARAYAVLDEINVRPQVLYLTKIRNKDAKVESQEVVTKEAKAEAAHS